MDNRSANFQNLFPTLESLAADKFRLTNACVLDIFGQCIGIFLFKKIQKRNNLQRNPDKIFDHLIWIGKSANVGQGVQCGQSLV